MAHTMKRSTSVTIAGERTQVNFIVSLIEFIDVKMSLAFEDIQIAKILSTYLQQNLGNLVSFSIFCSKSTIKKFAAKGDYYYKFPILVPKFCL
jgi:hypothetical protein